MFSMLVDRLRQCWHLILPSCCLWCSLPVQQHNRQLCLACQHALPTLPYDLCHYNLLWLPQVAKGLPKAPFEYLLSVAYYQQPYQHWIQQWKFQANHAAGELLQQQFAQLLLPLLSSKATLPQAILYVPMHPARQRQRGFNQAQILAHVAASTLQLPLLMRLKRVQQNHAQVGLSRQQRRRNLRQAFAVLDGPALPSHIALVDDVVTTGATAGALCRLLRKHGVTTISLWTLAVALRD